MANNTFLVPLRSYVAPAVQEQIDQAAAQAYQQGFNDGYALAVAQDDLELQAINKEVTQCISQQQTN